MADELTPRQRQVLRFIDDYRRRHGYPPTIRNICDAFDFTITAAWDHLKALGKKGCITRDYKVARSLVLTERGEREVLQ
jgi:repressor LexA